MTVVKLTLNIAGSMKYVQVVTARYLAWKINLIREYGEKESSRESHGERSGAVLEKRTR